MIDEGLVIVVIEHVKLDLTHFEGEHEILQACNIRCTKPRTCRQVHHGFDMVDVAPIHVYEASSNYAAHPLVIAAIDHCTNEVVNQVQPRSVPSIVLNNGGW